MPRPRTYPRTESRNCKHCGSAFEALTHNIRKGWGELCSRSCMYAWMKAQPRTAVPLTIRRLAPGEPVPTVEPKRYATSHGYVRLRWLVAPRTYVETYEHRVVSGVVTSDHVHHRNGDKTDNRPENLEILSPVDHAREHNRITWDVEAAHALYKAGWSLPQLGRKLGVHSSVILRGFQRRGLQTRPVSRTA